MNASLVATLGIADAGAVLIALTGVSARATPSPAPDAARGSRLFLQCAACHTVQPGAPNTVGPNLAGVVGATAGTKPGYSYSPALGRSGMVWNASTLDAFLKRPTQAVPGTKMGFAGVADATARADLIAYLTTLKARK